MISVEIPLFNSADNGTITRAFKILISMVLRACATNDLPVFVFLTNV